MSVPEGALPAAPGAPPEPPNSRRTSQLLREFVASHTEPRITLGALRDALGDRGFGVLLFIERTRPAQDMPAFFSSGFSCPVIHSRNMRMSHWNAQAG